MTDEGRGNPAFFVSLPHERRSGVAMSTPPPQISHTTEIVIATVVGAGVGVLSGNYLLGGIVGIVLGIGLSVAKTLYVDRKRRRR
jgi:hypothetical protein